MSQNSFIRNYLWMILRGDTINFQNMIPFSRDRFNFRVFNILMILMN